MAKSTGKLTAQEPASKDGDRFRFPGHCLKVSEVFNLSEESDLILDFSRDIVQLGKVLGFASRSNETLVIANGGAVLQVRHLGLGIDPGDPLALEHADATFGRVHQLLDWGVECWQFKEQTSFPAVPLLEPLI